MNGLLKKLEPKDRGLLIDLVRETGMDVSEWSDFAGGPSKAASNPKFCYEWSFIEDDIIILNLWFENLLIEDGKAIQRLNLRGRKRREKKFVWKKRAARVDHAIRTAYNLGLPFRAIICSGRLRTESHADVKASSVKKRSLDKVAWAVKSYNDLTGDCILERGLTPIIPKEVKEDLESDDTIYNGFEGEKKKRFVWCRKRERRLRQIKIENALLKNNGRLICEVPGCGFDFAKTYGSIGEEFAEVHHKFPLKRCTFKRKKDHAH
jgi:5-methylcytosine-specific restriction protein A